MALFSIFKKTRLYKTIFGYDLFISYSRKDSLDYAYNIAKHFIGLGYACYIDQLSSISPGKELPETIKSAIQKTNAFVLIGSEGAKLSEPIKSEIHLFLEHSKNKPLIPVTIDDHINHTALWFENINGLALIDDTNENLKNGTPSRDVLDRIDNALIFTKKSIKLRNTALLTLLGVLAVAAASIGVSTYKIDSANKEVLRSDSLTQRAENKKKEALILKGKADSSAMIARFEKLNANRERDTVLKEIEQIARDREEALRNLKTANGNLAAREKAVKDLDTKLNEKIAALSRTEKINIIREFQSKASNYYKNNNHEKAKEIILTAIKLEKEYQLDLNSTGKLAQFINNGLVIQRYTLQNGDMDLVRTVLSATLLKKMHSILVSVKDSSKKTNTITTSHIVYNYVTDHIINTSSVKPASLETKKTYRSPRYAYKCYLGNDGLEKYVSDKKAEGFKVACSVYNQKIMLYKPNMIILKSENPTSYGEKITYHTNTYKIEQNSLRELFFIANNQLMLLWESGKATVSGIYGHDLSDLETSTTWNNFNTFPVIDNINWACIQPDGIVKGQSFQNNFTVPVQFNDNELIMLCDEENKHLIKISKTGRLEYCNYEFNGPLYDSKTEQTNYTIGESYAIKLEGDKTGYTSIIFNSKINFKLNEKTITDYKDGNPKNIYFNDQYAIFHYINTANEKVALLFQKKDSVTYFFRNELPQFRNLPLNQFPVHDIRLVDTRNYVLWLYDNNDKAISRYINEKMDTLIKIPYDIRQLKMIGDAILVYDTQAEELKVIDLSSSLNTIGIKIPSVNMFNSIMLSPELEYLYIGNHYSNKNIKLLNPLSNKVFEIFKTRIDGASY